MRQTLRCAGLLVALAVLLPVSAADDKKKSDADPLPKDTKEAAEKLVTAGKVTGKLIQVDPKKKYFTLQITLKYGVPNQGAVNALLNAQNELARTRDPKRAVQLRIEMAKQQANLITIKEEKKNVEFQAGDEVKVRSANPPPTFDDKGQLKKYTRKELDELKGPDKKLPGYPAEFDVLRQDQIVTVLLVKKKDAGKPARPQPRSKDADVDTDLLGDDKDNKPQVSMIVVELDPVK